VAHPLIEKQRDLVASLRGRTAAYGFHYCSPLFSPLHDDLSGKKQQLDPTQAAVAGHRTYGPPCGPQWFDFR